MIWLPMAFLAGMLAYTTGFGWYFSKQPNAGLDDTLGYLVLAPLCAAGGSVILSLLADALLAVISTGDSRPGLSAGVRSVLIICCSLMGSAIGMMVLMGGG